MYLTPYLTDSMVNQHSFKDVDSKRPADVELLVSSHRYSANPCTSKWQSGNWKRDCPTFWLTPCFYTSSTNGQILDALVRLHSFTQPPTLPRINNEAVHFNATS